MDVDNRVKYVGGIIASAIVLQLLWSAFFSAPDIASLLSDIEAPEKLVEHTQEFSSPEVVEVREGVYVAIGYALANSIMLEGPEGLVIVDVTESYESGKEVYAAFREITDKPIKAIIYTHNHADHVYGGKAFIEDSEDLESVQIWAHHTILSKLKLMFSTVQTITFKRAMRQFGALLPEHINAGIGPKLHFNPDATMNIVYPNNFLYEDQIKISAAGLNLTLIHIPGETSDQIGVWMEDTKTLLSADDIYRAFPNLYAIRGTTSRDLLDWVASLDRMRNLKPEHLVPSHTRPVEGADKIFKLLTEYRDAIQLVHDQTVRYMNKGLFPDEIVEKVQLPTNLQNNPFLLEFYGTVGWSVRGVFNTYMGWFSGDPVDLNPLMPLEKAKHMALLAGGVGKLMSSAQDALDNDEAQWALELTSHVLRLEPKNYEALKVQALALKELASTQISANGRNYYITYAFEQHKLLTNKPSLKGRENVIKNVTLMDLFITMSRRLKAEYCEDYDKIVAFEFTDEQVNISVHVRNGIAEVTTGIKDGWDLKVITTGKTWRELAAKTRSALAAYTTGAIQVEGSSLQFKDFMDLFAIDD